MWLQPGTFDDEVVRFLGEAGFEAAVLGEGGEGDEGWCVLVDGEKALRDGEKALRQGLLRKVAVAGCWGAS